MQNCRKFVAMLKVNFGQFHANTPFSNAPFSKFLRDSCSMQGAGGFTIAAPRLALSILSFVECPCLFLCVFSLLCKHSVASADISQKDM